MDTATLATGEVLSHMAVVTEWEEVFAADLPAAASDGVVDMEEVWAEEELFLLLEDGTAQLILMEIHIPGIPKMNSTC